MFFGPISILNWYPFWTGILFDPVSLLGRYTFCVGDIFEPVSFGNKLHCLCFVCLFRTGILFDLMYFLDWCLFWSGVHFGPVPYLDCVLFGLVYNDPNGGRCTFCAGDIFEPISYLGRCPF